MDYIRFLHRMNITYPVSLTHAMSYLTNQGFLVLPRHLTAVRRTLIAHVDIKGCVHPS